MQLRLFVLFLLVFRAAWPSKRHPSSAVDNDFIQKQFGSTCTLMPGPPQMKADMDGDGIEDLVVAAHCTNALVDQAEKNFTVIDPYNSFYGYGNTKITTQFLRKILPRGAWFCWSFMAPAGSLARGYPEGEIRDYQSAFQTDFGEKADSKKENGDGDLCR